MRLILILASKRNRQNFYREKRSVAFVTGYSITFLVILYSIIGTPEALSLNFPIIFLLVLSKFVEFSE